MTTASITQNPPMRNAAECCLLDTLAKVNKNHNYKKQVIYLDSTDYFLILEQAL
jgi:hypothetical protein